MFLLDFAIMKKQKILMCQTLQNYLLRLPLIVLMRFSILGQLRKTLSYINVLSENIIKLTCKSI